MQNGTILLKIKQRLNKLDSSDYDNMESWQIVEAFNKGQVAWCRRQLHGMNQKQEGDEQSKRRIDDLQTILTALPINLFKKDRYFSTKDDLPANYFEWKRVSAYAESDCCDNNRAMVITLVEEANVDELLRDKNKQPSFDWGETFCTLANNKLKIWTNDEFEVPEAILHYYRQPRKIQIAGVTNPDTLLTSTVNVESEFKDDIIELFVDEAAKILAGDIESFNQVQTAEKGVESNN
jgi:hypothetical protein